MIRTRYGWIGVTLLAMFAVVFTQAGGEPPAAGAPVAKADAWPPPVPEAARGKPPGLFGPVGPKGEPRLVKSLNISQKGTHENLLVDRAFGNGDAVKIKADGAILRHCEIRNGKGDGVEVYANDVLIESCKIHHFLAGTFKEQMDAHGITGRPNRLIIRNCEIYMVSGDSVQFDPGRGPWTDVLIENCDFWTAPLPEDMAGFHKGEQPGEDGVDTKQQPSNPRSKLVIRNSVVHGFQKGGQTGNNAALNIKNHVEVRVENCVFHDNQIDLRLRGPAGGTYGGAHVTVQDCFFYTSDTAIRMEDKIENLKVHNPAFGDGVKRKYQKAGGEPGAGFETTGEKQAPPLAEVLKKK